MFGLHKDKKNFCEDVHTIYPNKGTKAFQGFEVNEVLFEGKSPYQDVAIYSNDALGTVLVLDGAIQITTKDEFVYQEMMAHVPMFTHGKAENVLIIGGGDGGILREVLRHKGIKKAVMAEIDQIVIDQCIKYLPEINKAGKIYEDPRTQLIIGDAIDYVANADTKFDCVIIDSTDPIGPGEKLFSDAFYKNLSKILNDGAFVVTQGGVPFFQEGEIAGTLNGLARAGLQTSCYVAAIPTYYGGFMTLGFGKKATQAIKLPTLKELETRYTACGLSTKYYSPAMHLAAFVLPPWISADIENNMHTQKQEEAA